MLIAAIIKETQAPDGQSIQLPQEQLIWLSVVSLILLIVSASVYARMLGRVSRSGGCIRNDLFGLPDTMVAVALTTVLILLLGLQLTSPGDGSVGGAGKSRQALVEGFQLINNALVFALPAVAILGLLVRRAINVPELFGLRRVALGQAIVLAGALIFLLLPVFYLTFAITYEFLGKNAQPQELVSIYQDAAKTGKSGILWQIAVAAVCIAPVSEEILFRGYLYPVFKQIIGPLPAAFGSSLLFAGIHNNALGFPGLALLALVLTLVYERTGSLLVPILMHAWFNGLNLLLMWWSVTHGLVR